MIEHRLSEMFKEYDATVQRVLRGILRLEQQHITDPLRTNSAALKKIMEGIDQIVEENCPDED